MTGWLISFIQNPYLDSAEKLISAIVGILALVGFIYAAVRWGGKIIHKLWHYISRHRPKIPRETVRIVPNQTLGVESHDIVNKKVS
jgi:hypothetical protein